MRRRQRLAAALLTAALAPIGCAEETPEVEIKTYVGKSYEQKDPELAQRAALQVFKVAVPEMLGNGEPKASEGPTTGVPQTVHPPRSKEELEDLLSALRKGPLDEIAGPARRLAAADPSLWPQLRELMLADRKAPKGDYRSLLKAIGGDVPNRYGHFNLAWKKAHGHDVKLSTAWFEDLLSLPRSKVSVGLLEVYRDCVLQTALFAAASKIGHNRQLAPDVVASLLDAGYTHQGTFRDEVGRALVEIGNEAIPSLIVESIPPSTRKRDAEKPEVKRAKFAEHTLDKMDRLHPARATSAVREEPALLANTLDAYGKAKIGEAATVLLEYADDDSPPVRRAAREAFMAYVEGPAPKVAARTVRLIGGGVGHAFAYLSYRERARLAIRAQIDARAPALIEPECDVVRENGKVDPKCEAQPLRLATAYFAWLNLQRELDETATIDAALADTDLDRGAEQLDRLLARSPELSSKDRLASFYERLATRKVAEGNSAAAAALWRKSSMLVKASDPQLAVELHVKALQTEASLPELPSTGRRMLLSAAAALDETIETPSAETEDRATAAPDRVGRSRLYGGAGLLCVALFAVGLLGGPLRRRAGL